MSIASSNASGFIISLGLIIFIIFNFIIFFFSVFGFVNAKNCRHKVAQTFAVISIIISLIPLLLLVIGRFLPETFFGIDEFILFGGLTILTIIMFINIVFLIVTRKNKTLSPNKINKSIPVCPKCNMPVSQNKNFCKNCGERINTI